MNRDFTYFKYEEMLNSILDAGYFPTTFLDYFINKEKYTDKKVFILRHDIDKMPENAVAFAKIQHKYGVCGTYYWRIVSESFSRKAIAEVIELGHELGYHYEDITLVGGDFEKAIALFEKNLNIFREFYPVKTICMHGSPSTKWDNKLTWTKYDYHQYGVIAEPYFDINFDEVFYLTDTGRGWNNSKVSVRDIVSTKYNFTLNGTNDVIDKIKSGVFPKHVMYNIHPQRWNNNIALWSRELVLQSLKNEIKRAIYVNKNK